MGSQYGETRWILDHLAHLLSERPRTYVEVGGCDGIDSNTVELEQVGWHGFICEPDPRSAAKASRNRACVVYPVAIGSRVGLCNFYINDKVPAWSGLVANSPFVGSVRSIPVQVRRLDAMIRHHGLLHVHVLSIDTEGTELDVWSTRGVFNPDIVIIEYDTIGQLSKSSEIIKRFEQDDYILVHTTKGNHIFIRRELYGSNLQAVK